MQFDIDLVIVIFPSRRFVGEIVVEPDRSADPVERGHRHLHFEATVPVSAPGFDRRARSLSAADGGIRSVDAFLIPLVIIAVSDQHKISVGVVTDVVGDHAPMRLGTRIAPDAVLYPPAVERGKIVFYRRRSDVKDTPLRA